MIALYGRNDEPQKREDKEDGMINRIEYGEDDRLYELSTSSGFKRKGFKDFLNDDPSLLTLIEIPEGEEEMVEDGKKAQLNESAWVIGNKAGLEDAWDAARTISRMDIETIKKVFSKVESDINTFPTVFREYTAPEAMRALCEYEAKQAATKQDDIKIGNEVTAQGDTADKCCGTCKYRRYESAWEEYYCTNEESDNFEEEIIYGESCEDYEHGK